MIQSIIDLDDNPSFYALQAALIMINEDTFDYARLILNIKEAVIDKRYSRCASESLFPLYANHAVLAVLSDNKYMLLDLARDLAFNGLFEKVLTEKENEDSTKIMLDNWNSHRPCLKDVYITKSNLISIINDCKIRLRFHNQYQKLNQQGFMINNKGAIL